MNSSLYLAAHYIVIRSRDLLTFGRCRYGNRVERNHLSQLAQTTRDLGGLSFIGQGHTDTIVRHNCVKDVIGMDIDDSGRLMRPFYSWGVYLDNFATGFRVSDNILNGNVLGEPPVRFLSQIPQTELIGARGAGGVFIHGGSSNAIVNNIFYRSSNASMPGPGHYGHVRCALLSTAHFTIQTEQASRRSVMARRECCWATWAQRWRTTQ